MTNRFATPAETLIANALSGLGWDGINRQATPEEVEYLERKKQQAAENKRRIAKAWADMYDDPAGREAIEMLFDITLRRTVFRCNIELPPDQVAMHGAFREGQNAVATEIARLIAIGRGEEAPPPAQD